MFAPSSSKVPVPFLVSPPVPLITPPKGHLIIPAGRERPRAQDDLVPPEETRAHERTDRLIGTVQIKSCVRHGGDVYNARVGNRVAARQAQRPRVQGRRAAGRRPNDAGLQTDLRAWRSEIARKRGVPAYVVLHDATIDGIAASRPTTLNELRNIPGIGDKKLEHYGDELIALVKAAES